MSLPRLLHHGPYTRRRPTPLRLPAPEPPEKPPEAFLAEGPMSPFAVIFPDISALPCPRIYVRELPRPPRVGPPRQKTSLWGLGSGGAAMAAGAPFPLPGFGDLSGVPRKLWAAVFRGLWRGN
eukprot:RCo025410